MNSPKPETPGPLNQNCDSALVLSSSAYRLLSLSESGFQHNQNSVAAATDWFEKLAKVLTSEKHV